VPPFRLKVTVWAEPMVTVKSTGVCPAALALIVTVPVRFPAFNQLPITVGGTRVAAGRPVLSVELSRVNVTGRVVPGTEPVKSREVLTGIAALVVIGTSIADPIVIVRVAVRVPEVAVIVNTPGRVPAVRTRVIGFHVGTVPMGLDWAKDVLNVMVGWGFTATPPWVTTAVSGTVEKPKPSVVSAAGAVMVRT